MVGMDLGNRAWPVQPSFFRVQLRSRWDRGLAPIFCDFPGHEDENDDKFGCVYVDNIGVLATSLAKASELMGKLTTTFDDAGLLTHEVLVSDSHGVALGTVLDCERRRSSLAPRCF